jgi:hypothetical protein
MTMEILPGKSIGPVRLGARASELPQSATIVNGVGQIQGVHFAVAGGAVDDVWIEDLRSFPAQLRYRGQVIAKDVALQHLKTMFGACERVPDIIGGTFFNCSAGITLGTDAGGRGDFVQIRLKRR